MQLNLDRYTNRTSLIHSLDPRVKVGGALLLIVATVTLPDAAWVAILLALLVTFLFAYLANIGPFYALKRSFVAAPFALAAVTIIFTLPGQPVANVAIGGWNLTISDAGLTRFGSIVTRSWVAVQIAILMTATTRFPDMMHALRHLRMPTLIVAIVGFMYRYLALLSDEVFRLLRARESRSAGLPGYRMGGSIGWRANVAGNMAGQLFLRSYERSDRIYNAMLARGYQGEFLTINPHVMQTRDWIALLILVLIGFGLHTVALLFY
jgi:cobalt/nickel transport system permease protein